MFLYTNSLRAGLEPACGVYFHRPHNGPMSTIPSPRVPEVNYSPAWCLPVDRLIPYRNTLQSLLAGIGANRAHPVVRDEQILPTTVCHPLGRAMCFYMVTMMGFEPTNYPCDAGCATLNIQLVYSVSNQTNSISLHYLSMSSSLLPYRNTLACKTPTNLSIDVAVSIQCVCIW